jgi:hypothetical protein
MTIDRRRGMLFTLLALGGCAVQPPPDPRALDCATLDRAAERFPEECGEPASDAGVGDDASTGEDGGPFDGGP